MTFVLVTGSTDTATIDGISAAGADPALTYHTPAADLEIVEYGRPVFASELPTSPTGCPTPAVITQAVRELIGFDVLAVDSGLATRTATPTVTVGAQPGNDIREREAVTDAEGIFERARAVGRELSSESVFVGESVPGGTTTALGVLRALGEPFRVSSSLPENPFTRKKAIVENGLEASGIEAGDASGDPLEAVRLMGDPVLPAVMGTAVGAVETGAEVTLAGGTQLLTAGALVRHFGIEAPLTLSTTVFVAEDTPDLEDATDTLDIELNVTDPEFERSNHVSMTQYCQGEAKEGVGMGGALALAERHETPAADVREQIAKRYDALTNDGGSNGP